MHADTDRHGAWGRYWASGALHACATSFDGNYDGALAAFWREVFDGLAPGERVLDLACGNGALGRLLIEQRPEPSIGCDAVDLAPLAPRWVNGLAPAQAARLRFHAETRAEALPFEDGRFALVVSQYGIEYTALEHSVPELLRVLRRPGRIALVLHHAASRPVALARDEVAHIDWLRADDGLLAVSRRMVPLVARAATAQGRAALAADPAADAQRQRFNELQREVGARIEAAVCPDVLHEVREGVARVFALVMQSGPTAALEVLGELEQALADSRLRLDELCRCALDADALGALAQRLGGGARVAELRERGQLMGWTLLAEADATG